MLTGDRPTSMQNPLPVHIAGIQGSLPVTTVGDSGFVAGASGVVAGTAAVQLLAALEGKSHCVSALHLTSVSAVGFELQLLAGAAVVYRAWLPGMQCVCLTFPDRLVLPAGAALSAKAAAIGGYWVTAVGATR